ncbi:MAG TPA: hypothetical protein VHD57_14560 [Vicinamibacterales bacterium]|jgi:hypothetical protein|nr:hypothetical protein [Vicinamibacterales bacterium]
MLVAPRVALAAALLAVPAGLLARQVPARSLENANYSLRATLDPVNLVLRDDETTTPRLARDSVQDLASAAGADVVEIHDRVAETGRPPVDIRLLLQRDHREQADRYLAAARAALVRYGAWFGASPSSPLTIVDPAAPIDHPRSTSMADRDHPAFVVADTRWIAPSRGTTPDETVIRGIGREMFGGVAGASGDDVIDEGLATYVTTRVMADAFPGRYVAVGRYFGGLAVWTYEDVPWSREVDGDRPAGTSLTARADKTALALETLERMLGWDTMRHAIATYLQQRAATGPAAVDFVRVVSDASGRDLTWFFDEVDQDDRTFDYRVAGVAATTRPNGAADSTVVIERRGDGVFPIDVRVAFSDRSSVVEHWDGQARRHAFTYRRAAQVRTVEVDPDRVLLLDVNTTNNTWTSRPNGAHAAWKWTLHWLTWMEQVLVTYAACA